MTAELADVLIIGGGSTGTSIAWQLAQREAGRVVLLEQGELGGGGTGRSCAIVRTHYTHEELARLALHCQHVFENFEEIVGAPAGYRRVGWLALLGPADRAQLATNVEMQKSTGIDAEFMTKGDLEAMFPEMNVEDVGGAAYEPASGYADPYLTTNAFADAARRLGAEVLTGVAVDDISERSGGYQVRSAAGYTWEARTLIIAAGAQTVTLVRPLGIELPIVPIWHSIGIVRYKQAEPRAYPTISDRVAGNYYRPLDADHALVGYTGPLDGVEGWDFGTDHPAEPHAIQKAISCFAARFPGWQPMALEGSYTGVYDCTPDVQPLIGEVDGHERMFVAAGFSGHGFKLAPAVGTLVTELVIDGVSSFGDAKLFDPGRFAEERPIVSAHPYSVPTLG